jgi:hypothetical protein
LLFRSAALSLLLHQGDPVAFAVFDPGHITEIADVFPGIEYSRAGRCRPGKEVVCRGDAEIEDRSGLRRNTDIAPGQRAARAEAYLGDDQFIGARDLTRHRANLVADIASEVKALQASFAPVRVTLTGLESRIITQPSGPLGLEFSSRTS